MVAGAVGGQTKDIVESILHTAMSCKKKGQGRHEAGQQGSSAADMQIDERQGDLNESQRWGFM